MSEFDELQKRVTLLEDRIAKQKDWRQKYEESKRSLKDLKDLYAGTERLRGALVEFLALQHSPRPASVAGGQQAISLTEKVLAITVNHEEQPVAMTTNNVVGKIMFAVVSELPREDGFTEAALSAVLAEHGWNIGHSTLAPKLGVLVHDGLLIKLDTKPTRYRLPQKVTINVSKE